MNMTLTQVIQILGIAEGQQISDEVSEAIRTVLAEMQEPEKDVVEVVRCKDCCYSRKDYGNLQCKRFCEAAVYDEDFCSYGERK